MRSNCIVFAVALYWRRREKGKEGYLMIRRSRMGAFPHCLYAETRLNGTMRIVSFKPSHPSARKMPPPLFEGGSRWGDL